MHVVPPKQTAMCKALRNWANIKVAMLGVVPLIDGIQPLNPALLNSLHFPLSLAVIQHFQRDAHQIRQSTSSHMIIQLIGVIILLRQPVARLLQSCIAISQVLMCAIKPRGALTKNATNVDLQAGMQMYPGIHQPPWGPHGQLPSFTQKAILGVTQNAVTVIQHRTEAVWQPPPWVVVPLFAVLQKCNNKWLEHISMSPLHWIINQCSRQHQRVARGCHCGCCLASAGGIGFTTDPYASSCKPPGTQGQIPIRWENLHRLMLSTRCHYTT
jgi:hypothetical protein